MQIISGSTNKRKWELVMAIITISRGTLSGGQLLAQMVSERLNYRSVSREIIVKATEKYGVPEYKLFEAIQKSPSFVQRLTFEREKYLAIIQAALCEFVKDDNVVYHGHAGHFLLKGISHVLRVRILAPMGFRIREAMKRQNLSEKDAVKHIQEIDKQRIKWTKFLYGVDWRSPELYDMIFNIENASLDFVCDMIEKAVKEEEFQTTSASQQALNNLLLSSQVKAALTKVPNVRLGEFDIGADRGTVIITGKLKSEELLQAIMQAAAEVPGVKKVKSEAKMNYRYQGIDA
jgi:cytidylate kinase